MNADNSIHYAKGPISTGYINPATQVSMGSPSQQVGATPRPAPQPLRERACIAIQRLAQLNAELSQAADSLEYAVGATQPTPMRPEPDVPHPESLEFQLSRIHEELDMLCAVRARFYQLLDVV